MIFDRFLQLLLPFAEVDVSVKGFELHLRSTAPDANAKELIALIDVPSPMRLSNRGHAGKITGREVRIDLPVKCFEAKVRRTVFFSTLSKFWVPTETASTPAARRTLALGS